MMDTGFLERLQNSLIEEPMDEGRDSMEVVIYTTDTCPNCKVLKGLLEKEGISFEERNMSEDEWKYEALSQMIMSAPTVLVAGGKYVGDPNEIFKKILRLLE